MPRRPLFCRTCTYLLDQLAKAAEAAGIAKPFELNPTAPKGLDTMIAEKMCAMDRHLELRSRAQQHLELGHAYSRDKTYVQHN
jgi:hypothetical protein